jgi:DNA-binding PucR family transcriptional regulator
LRHTSRYRPVVVGPRDVGIFDELVVSHDEQAAQLIPETIRKALNDPTLRATLQTLVDADLSIGLAATRLNLHPNSLRYRLRRIAELTGRDPRRLTDLLELVAAMRILSTGGG